MFMRFFILFTIVPLVELALLIELGKAIGLWNTIGIVLITGALGAALARREGFSVITRIQTELRSGQLPGDSLFDGALILSGGLLLLTPGLVTDITGFILLIPPTRSVCKKFIKNYFSKKIRTGEINVNYRVER